jgi:hypothetical protein
MTKRREVFGIADEQFLDRLFETRGVGHNVPKRDRLWVRRWNLEVEVVVYIAIEIKLSLLDQLHHGSPGEQLGDGYWAKESLVCDDRNALHHIGISVASCEENLAIFDDNDRCSGNVFPAKLFWHDTVEKGLQI